MRYGIRQLKDGELSQAIQRASRGEEIVVTDHGRPVARIVPYQPVALPKSVQRLVEQGLIELRSPAQRVGARVRLTRGAESAVDLVRQQRR